MKMAKDTQQNKVPRTLVIRGEKEGKLVTVIVLTSRNGLIINADTATDLRGGYNTLVKAVMDYVLRELQKKRGIEYRISTI